MLTDGKKCAILGHLFYTLSFEQREPHQPRYSKTRTLFYNDQEAPMGQELTREILEQLRKPFAASKISFKVQTKPSEKGNSLVVAYIDARDVMERLDEVVGPDWSDRYEKAGTAQGLVCYLTVCGVTRADVGDENNENEPVKSAYSDAFKRAAVKFGVGRFLYDLPKMWAKAKPAGKSFVLEDGEIERLHRQVDDFLAGKKPGAPASSGSNGSSAARPAPKPAAPAKTPVAEKKVGEPADLRKRHGELWMQCSKAGLVKGKEAVQAWSVTPETPDAEIASKIAGMQAALKAVGIKA